MTGAAKIANLKGSQITLLPLLVMRCINLFEDENIQWKRVPRPSPLIHASIDHDDTIIRPEEGLVRHEINILYSWHMKNCLFANIFTLNTSIAGSNQGN